MRRYADIALGLLTAFPLLFSWGAALAALPWLRRSIREMRDVRSLSDSMASAIVGVVLLTFALMVFYLLHLARNAHVPGRQKVRWGAAIVVFNAAGMLAYWYVFFWRPARPLGRGANDTEPSE